MTSTEQIVQAWERWQKAPNEEFLLTGELLQLARTLDSQTCQHLDEEIHNYIRLSDEREWRQASELLSQLIPDSSECDTSHDGQDFKVNSTAGLIEAIRSVGTHLDCQQPVPPSTAERLYRAVKGARERGVVPLGLGGIKDLAVSPNNQWSAVACDTGAIVLLDRAGRVRHQWQACEYGEVRSVAFAPSGQEIVTGGGDGSVRLWTLEGKRIGSQQLNHEGATLSVAISPDGDRIASSGSDLVVHVWSVDTPGLANPLPDKGVESGRPASGYPVTGHQTLIRTLQFDPLGRWLLGGGSNGLVYLWDWRTGRLERTFDTRMGAITSLGIDRAGDRLVCGARDGELWVQSIGQGTQSRWQVASQPIAAAIPMDTGQIVTGGGNAGAVQWHCDGTVNQRLRGDDNDDVTAVAFSPSGDWMLYGTRAGLVRLWDLREFSQNELGEARQPLDWQHWLHVACDRLQYHPALNDSQSAAAREASKVCSLHGYRERNRMIPFQQ